MQTAPDAQDELFAATVNNGLLIMPSIESRADWTFLDGSLVGLTDVSHRELAAKSVN